MRNLIPEVHLEVGADDPVGDHLVEGHCQLFDQLRKYSTVDVIYAWLIDWLIDIKLILNVHLDVGADDPVGDHLVEGHGQLFDQLRKYSTVDVVRNLPNIKSVMRSAECTSIFSLI
jgi:hypothetical protein